MNKEKETKPTNSLIGVWLPLSTKKKIELLSI